MKAAITVIAMILFWTVTSSQTVQGYATYYASRFEGKRTASGETFRHAGMTAASNSFPFGTVLRVTNLATCKTVTVRINDRMAESSARRNRVVDLTATAARKIGFFEKFITRVIVEVVTWP